MAGLTRLELATFRVTGGRSNQTELQPHNLWVCHLVKKWRKPEEVAKQRRLAPRAGLEPAT